MSEESILTVIIPAYNEAENLKIVLPGLISKCREKNWKIIIVNDGSKDGSKEILESHAASGDIKVVHHKLNKGYGAAIKSGISTCDTDYCITIDADGQHQFEDIERLFQILLKTDADMVVGSRKGTRSASIARGVGKGIIRFIAKIQMPVPIYDINSGMKICRTDLAKKYLYLAPDSMSYSDVITLLFLNNRHLVLEESIKITKRVAGRSTIGMHTAFQTVMEIINIVILFNPMKIFLPISIFFFIATLSYAVPLLIIRQVVSTGMVLGVVSGLIFFLLGLIAEQLSLIRRRHSNDDY